MDLADGRALVAERRRGLDLTALEAFMLSELRRLSPLPVPDVLASEPDLLLLAYVEHDPAASTTPRSATRPSCWPPPTPCTGQPSATSGTR